MLTTTLLLTILSADAANPRLSVMDFSGEQSLKPLCAGLAGAVANELQSLQLFEVTSSDQLRSLLSLERQQQLLGCPDDTCRGAAVLSLGYDELVTGRVTKLAGKTGSVTLELVLVHTADGRRTASDVLTAPSEAELMRLVKPAVVKLVQPLLKGKTGSLVVDLAELGATVKVDDVVVGVTPLGRVPVTAGPHVLKVEKEGFVTYQKDVRVKGDETVAEPVRLVPSPDFVAAYRSKNSKLRIAAWASTGVAVAAGAVGLAMGVRAQSLYGTPDTKGTFQYERAFVLAGIEEDPTGNHRQLANDLKSSVDSARLLSIVMVGVAAAAAAGAVTLWILGDSPSKYDAYLGPDVKVAALLAPGLGGFTLSGRF